MPIESISREIIIVKTGNSEMDAISSVCPVYSVSFKTSGKIVDIFLAVSGVCKKFISICWFWNILKAEVFIEPKFQDHHGNENQFHTPDN